MWLQFAFAKDKCFFLSHKNVKVLDFIKKEKSVALLLKYSVRHITFITILIAMILLLVIIIHPLLDL